MQSFKEWVVENHPEYQIDEVQFPSWLRNTVAPAVAAAGFLGGSMASAADPVPPRSAPAPIVAQANNSITVTKEYDFDDNEEIRDAVKEATMEIKAKIAKRYGTNVLSGIGRPQVKIDRKNQTVIVTIQVPQQTNTTVPTPTPTKNDPSVQRRVSRGTF